MVVGRPVRGARHALVTVGDLLDRGRASACKGTSAMPQLPTCHASQAPEHKVPAANGIANKKVVFVLGGPGSGKGTQVGVVGGGG